MKIETLFLRAVLVLAGALVLALSIFALPSLVMEAAAHLPTYLVYPAFIGLYLTTIPFFFALYQAFKILGYIDKNTGLSDHSVKAFKLIKYCAVAISALYLAGIPLVAYLAELDDAPGAMLFAFGIIALPLVVAAFAGVLQKVFKNGVERLA